MLRTNLILAVISLTIGLNASSPKTNETNVLNQGQINGNVQSLETQGALSMAQVVLYSEGSDLIKVSSADQNGDFIFNNLPEGRYYLAISHIGHKPEVIDNIIVKSLDSLVKMNDVMLEGKIYEIEEVAIKAERINAPYLSVID